MKIKELLLLTFITLGLSSCLDHWYPNGLSGSINNGVYTNHARNGRLPSFDTYSVMIPQHYNEYQTPMLKSHEVINKDYTIVSFGPAVTDHTIYRVMIVNLHGRPLQVLQDEYLPLLINAEDKGVNQQWHRIYETNTKVNNHAAVYQVYTLDQPNIYNYISKFQPGIINEIHLLYFVDYGKYGVIFWIRYHSDSALNQINIKDRKKIINQQLNSQQLFLHSFHIDEYKRH